MTAPFDVEASFREMAAMQADLRGTMSPVPKQPKKVQKTYRINPRVYDAAMEKAEARGETVSDVIQRRLEEYVEDDA